MSRAILSFFYVFSCPGGIHRRKLIFVRFQCQRKIGQCWSCFHDSVIKIHNTAYNFIRYIILPFINKTLIPKWKLTQQSSTSKKKKRLTSGKSRDHGLSEPCLKYPWEFSPRDISSSPKVADFCTRTFN